MILISISCKSSYAGIIRIRLRVHALAYLSRWLSPSAPLIFYAVVRA